jgi:hypothetical protein
MLESDRTYFIKEIGDLKDFVTVAYVIIEDIYQEVNPTHIVKRCNIKDSILIDSEIISFFILLIYILVHILLHQLKDYL